MSTLLNPNIGNLEILGLIIPGVPGGGSGLPDVWVDAIGFSVGPYLTEVSTPKGRMQSDDNYYFPGTISGYGGGMGACEYYYGDHPISGSVAAPGTIADPYGPIWFISTWAPVAVEITYDIVRYDNLNVEQSRTATSVYMNSINTWISGGTLAEATPGWYKTIENMKILWPSALA